MPAPGKTGFVLMGAAARAIWANPIHAYAAVTIGLSMVATIFIFLFATLYLPRAIAAAVTAAIMCGPIVWFYGAVIASYVVWLASFPAIAYFGVRYLRERRPVLAVATAIAAGLASILRADMTLFAGPLLVGVLAVGRAPIKSWVTCAVIVLGCSAAWFFSTAALTGGVTAYLRAIQEQRDYHLGLGAGGLGVAGSLARNSVKYGLFLLWNSPLLLVPAAWFLWPRRAPDGQAAELRLVALGLFPVLLFSLLMVTCTGGLIFPLLPLVGVAAARGLLDVFNGRERPVVAGLLVIAAMSALQFVYAPILPSTTQRNVIIDVMFTKQAGEGIRQRFHYNLKDFEIDSSLPNVIHQLRVSEPVPAVPDPSARPR